MTETELRQDYEMFTDLWRFYKRFCESSIADEYWEAVDQEANALREKHGSKLCNRLLLAVVDEFERRERNEESTI